MIDIAVRPIYAGGAKVVANAYRNAQPKLNYVYPYHQVVGFYLQNAGKPLSDLEPFRELGLNFDFYLEYGMKETAFDATWRVHFPKDMIR